MSKHTKGELHIGMRNGHNAAALFIYDGKDPHHDSSICQVYGIPLHTAVEDLPAVAQRYKDYERGIANAARLAQGWNLLNWLEEEKADSRTDAQVTVTVTRSSQIGSCNACTANISENGVKPHAVTQVALRSLTFRLCDSCRELLAVELTRLCQKS